jgi:hypothetical protein
MGARIVNVVFEGFAIALKEGGRDEEACTRRDVRLKLFSKRGGLSVS